MIKRGEERATQRQSANGRSKMHKSLIKLKQTVSKGAML